MQTTLSKTVVFRKFINSWFDPESLLLVAKSLFQQATSHEMPYRNVPDTKYINIQIDMRSGHFIVKTGGNLGESRMLTNEELQKICPYLIVEYYDESLSS